MKKQTYTLLGILALLVSYVLPSNAQQAFYIYRNDGIINTFVTTEIDSMTYSCIDIDGIMHSDYVVQEVYTPDSLYRIPLVLIDSVGFVTPETVYQPDVKHLEGEIRSYVIRSDSLTLVFQATTPSNVLPKIGDKLVTTEMDEVFKRPFVGQVAEVKVLSGRIEVVCEPVGLTDVFKTYYGVISGTSEEPAGARPQKLKDGTYGTEGIKTFAPGTLPFDFLNFENIPFSYEKSEQLSYQIEKAVAKISATPVIRYSAYMIVNQAYGINVSVTAFGDYTIEEEFALSGNVDVNFEKDIFKLKVPFPNAFVDFVFEIGVFAEAKGELGIEQKWSQRYGHIFNWEWNSKGHKTTEKVNEFQKIGDTHTGEVALKGSFGAGIYSKIGVEFFANKSLDIAELYLKCKGGLEIEGTYVPKKDDTERAKTGTLVYQQMKSKKIDINFFRGLSVEGKLFSWSISLDIPDFPNFPMNTKLPLYSYSLVPTFSDTKIEKTTNTSYKTSSRVSGKIPTTEKVGFALINTSDNNDATYLYTYDYKGQTSLIQANFANKTGIQYTVYPLVNYMGLEMIAEPYQTSSADIILCPNSNHPHLIDLGLPSGRKWTCCNVGASSPEEYGAHYQWEVAKDQSSSFGHTPSYDDCQELIENCTWQWRTHNNIYGCLFFGPNGNSIFLPATGWLHGSDQSERGIGTEGNYWTTTVSREGCAYDLQFDAERVFMDPGGTQDGYQSVRLVK